MNLKVVHSACLLNHDSSTVGKLQPANTGKNSANRVSRTGRRSLGWKLRRRRQLWIGTLLMCWH